MLAAGTVQRLANVFRLHDQPSSSRGSSSSNAPQQPVAPVPSHVLQCLRLLRGLTSVRLSAVRLLPGQSWPEVGANVSAIIIDLQATAMVRRRGEHK
jgi:hypothetical protein